MSTPISDLQGILEKRNALIVLTALRILKPSWATHLRLQKWKHGDALHVLARVWGKMSSLDAIYMQVRLSEARAAGGCASKFSVLCRSIRGKLTLNGFGGRSWHEMERRVSAMRRAGRWVKSYLKAEQIAEKEIPIRDSTAFSSLANTNTSAVDPSQVSTSHLVINNWFALIN